MTLLKKSVLSSWQKKMLYGAAAFLWLTGIVWLYFKYGVKHEDEFGIQTSPWQNVSLKLHGAGAILFLIIFGAILFHIPPGWRNKSQRSTGVFLLSVCIVLILTGWGLYYLGNENWRNISSLVHCILGTILPLMIFFHVCKIISRRSKTH